MGDDIGEKNARRPSTKPGERAPVRDKVGT
jgi:hypothetical protein